jgi:hypothetical protein
LCKVAAVTAGKQNPVSIALAICTFLGINPVAGAYTRSLLSST